MRFAVYQVTVMFFVVASRGLCLLRGDPEGNDEFKNTDLSNKFLFQINTRTRKR